MLNGNALVDCLENISSIPRVSSDILSFNVPTGAKKWFDDFTIKQPSKIIFAYDGFSLEKCIEKLNIFYSENTAIKNDRIPNLIIVNNKYTIEFSDTDLRLTSGQIIPPFSFYPTVISDKYRGYPLSKIINFLSLYVSWTPFMRFEFYNYLNDSYSIYPGKNIPKGLPIYFKR